MLFARGIFSLARLAHIAMSAIVGRTVHLGEGLVHETVAYIADFLFELGLVFVVVVLQPETLVSFLNQFVPASLLLK